MIMKLAINRKGQKCKEGKKKWNSWVTKYDKAEKESKGKESANQEKQARCNCVALGCFSPTFPRRKHLNPTNFFFPSPPSNQALAKNIFSPLFSHFFSILPIPPPIPLVGRMEKWVDRKNLILPPYVWLRECKSLRWKTLLFG